MHSDVDESFSAYWVQIEIDPGKGWCAQEISFSVETPKDVRVVSASPEEGETIRESVQSVNELVVDAGGSAPIVGRIEQDIAIARGRTRVAIGGHHYAYKWRGNSRDKVMVALGVQLAHARVPTELVSTWTESSGFGGGSCRGAGLIVEMRIRNS